VRNPGVRRPRLAAWLVHSYEDVPVTAIPEPLPVHDERSRRSAWRVIVSLGALGAMSALFLFVPLPWEKLGIWGGYLGVAIVVFIATASFILPIPYLFIVWQAHAYGGLDPVLLALSAGIAAAFGEMTGYVVGISGRDLIARGKWYEKADYWMRTYGFGCITFFSFIPNPFFDAIGFAAGVLRYPVWRFLIACLIGKGAKFYIAAVGTEIALLGCSVAPSACEVVRGLVTAVGHGN
jgi:membrane protein YqaA with SNARE-associated domain